jgi:hypothetical protein
MNDGLNYEKLAHDVVSELNKGKKVTHNVKLLGKLSEVKRQIDIKLDESDYDFVIYECKDWGRTVGVAAVGKLLSDLEDVGAKKAAIISNSAFTKGAVNMASKKGVDLLHLVRTDDPGVKVGIAATVLVMGKQIDAMSLGVRDSRLDQGPMMNMDPDVFTVVIEGKPLTINEYLRNRWNDELAEASAVGENSIELRNQEIIDINGDSFNVNEVNINYIVKMRYSKGTWTIQKAQGLYNVIDGSFHAYGNITSESLSIDEINDSFVDITDEEAANMKPSIILGAATHYRVDS